MNYAILLLVFFSLSAQASFKKKCQQVQNSDTTDTKTKIQINWIQTTFQTKDCNRLNEMLQGVKSLRALFPTHEPQLELSTYDPIESGTHALRHKLQHGDWEETQKVFKDLSFFQEFKNLKHVDLGSFNIKDVTLKSIISQLPTINSISIASSELNQELVNLIIENNLEVHITGNFVFNESIEKLNNQIGGIQNFSGRILDLKRFKNLKSLGLQHIEPESSLKELVIIKNLESLMLSTRYITKLSDISHLKYLKFLKIDCNENRTETHSVSCSSLYSEKIDFIEDLKFLAGLSIAVKKLESTRPFLNLKNLRFLSLSGNNLSTIPDLRKLKNLKVVNLSYNNITDMSNIQFVRADIIDLGYNDIKKVEDFPGIANTEILLDGNQINIDDSKSCPRNSSNISIAKFCSAQK